MRVPSQWYSINNIYSSPAAASDFSLRTAAVQSNPQPHDHKSASIHHNIKHTFRTPRHATITQTDDDNTTT